MDAAPTAHRFVLRQLPLSSKLVVALFLISAGVGYGSALVQLHFNGGAKPGQAIPGPSEAANMYHGPIGPKPMSQLERVLEAPETGPFNGAGSMRRAFANKSEGWSDALAEAKAKSEEKEAKDTGTDYVKRLYAEREGERLAMLEWICAGTPRDAYEKDAFTISAELAGKSITKEYVEEKQVKIKSLLTARCLSCHSDDGGRDSKTAQKAPLVPYDKLKRYTEVKTATAIQIHKLAQTTHVHLLGFAMLYGLTGLIFSFTSYPGPVRVVLSPWPLAMQLIEIGCWWLARLDAPHGPAFGMAIAVFGGLVAIGLISQIGLVLLDLFDRKGRAVILALLLAAAGVAAVMHFQVITPFLDKEKAEVTSEK